MEGRYWCAVVYGWQLRWIDIGLAVFAGGWSMPVRGLPSQTTAR